MRGLWRVRSLLRRDPERAKRRLVTPAFRPPWALELEKAQLQRRLLRARAEETLPDHFTALEIGVYWGGDLALWAQTLRAHGGLTAATAPRVRLIGVDLWEATDTQRTYGYAPRSSVTMARETGATRDAVGAALAPYDPFGVIELRQIDSQALDPAALRPLDFAFIDGNHHYDYARRDFAVVMARAAAGCVIGFDDCEARKEVVLGGPSVATLIREIDAAIAAGRLALHALDEVTTRGGGHCRYYRVPS